MIIVYFFSLFLFFVVWLIFPAPTNTPCRTLNMQEQKINNKYLTWEALNPVALEALVLRPERWVALPLIRGDLLDCGGDDRIVCEPGRRGDKNKLL